VHGLDGGDHHAAQRRGRCGRGCSEGEQEAATGLGCSGRQCISTTRPQPHRIKGLTGPFQTPAAEPAEELLSAVAEEEQADRDARYQAEYADT
jgi:hypothetical protein